jgi:transposase
MKDYTGKTVYVGIDVHKKTYSITCICEKMIVKRDTLKALPQILIDYLRKFFPNVVIKTAYEAGFSGFVLHRCLLAVGIDNIVVHAASVEIAARDRVKTDKRDSLKIATQLSDSRLKGIYVTSPQREAYREISRMREKIARDKRRVGSRLKSLLYRQGLIGPDEDDEINKKWLKKVSQYECNEPIKYAIDICINEWLFLKEKQKEIDAALVKQGLADNELEIIYRSAPGIGAVHARVLANELEDMKHFMSEKQLFSFTGLTPSEHSSGEHRRMGHISRQGRSILRKTLIQAAWKAINKDLSLQTIYEDIARRAGKKRAIVGIARRLIGRIRSCFKSNTLYQVSGIKKTVICPKTGEILLVVNY